MNFVQGISSVKFLSIIFLFIGQAANADVLVLKNGDRISGEISRIWDAEITIEPEYSDEFQVDMPAVDYIESERKFEIDLEDGRSVVAQLPGAAADGSQIVKTEDETLTVPLAQLFELEEPEEEFDWESNVDFSASLNSGNTDSYNTKLRADTTVQVTDHRHIGEITFFREKLSGTTTQENDLFKYSYNWIFRDPWFFAAQLSLERDPIIELDSRVIVGAGIGRDIWNTPRRKLSIQLSAGTQAEEIGMTSTNNAVAIWGLRYRQDFLGDDLELFHNHSITENVSGRPNTSLKTSTGVRYEITDLLYANASVDFDYESDPIDIAEHEDIALLLGLGLEF
jgi:putative salt-induced outer membrane protein YdiY